jgi:16S rRNA (guanine527-N7)-methyltransferase
LRKLLQAELARIGLTVSESTQDKLALYLEELERWNKKLNLTSLKGAELARRIVVEPAWVAHQLQLSGSLADIGSGNGCPAIAISVTRDLSRTHLIEARTKRCAFLRHIASTLQLRGIEVHRNRVEDITEKIAPVDCITLQAVSPTAELMNALRKLFPETTRVVWITSGSSAPTPTAKHISVPSSNSEVWDFRLDQF